MVRRSGSLLGVAGLLVLLGCTVNPATGARQFSLISESQEIAMGRQGAQETLASIPLVPDSTLQRYVRGVAMDLVAVAERPSLPWAFHVLDDASVNAFAYPGGFIFITRGILTHMTSEAELAGVLGHEIGHVTARHTATQLSRAQLAEFGLAVTTVVAPEAGMVLGAVGGSGLGLLFMKFSRDHEHQADELGFRYMTREGYDPRAISSMFAMLQQQAAMGGGGRLPEWQSTHPDPENRVARNDSRVAAAVGSGTLRPDSMTLARDRFLRRLEGMVFGPDPRQGYFEGVRFLHPDMRFQYDMPEGWTGSNQPAAVVSVSPGQDAVAVLTLAQGSSALAALREFLGQQGIAGSVTSTAPVNGLEAATGDFTATTQQGQEVRGGVIFVRHRDRLFRLLGYTTPAKAAQFGPAFRRMFGSFQELRDPAALNRQPNRIELVTLPRAMTVEVFHQTWPSVVPVDRIALINGVQPGATIPAGTLMKRVR